MIPRLDRLVRLDPTRLRALLLMLVAAIGFHLCATAAAGRWSWFPFAVVLAGAVVVAIRTDGSTEMLLFIGLGLDWWGATDRLSWWCLPAALCLLIAHSALTLVASGPDAATIPRELVLRWVRQTALVAAGCTAGGAVLLAIRQVGVAASWWIVPAALIVLAAVTIAFSEQLRRS